MAGAGCWWPTLSGVHLPHPSSSSSAAQMATHRHDHAAAKPLLEFIARARAHTHTHTHILTQGHTMALIRQAALNVPWRLDVFQGAAYHSPLGAPPAVLSRREMQITLGPPGHQLVISLPRVALFRARRTFAYMGSDYVWRPYSFRGLCARARNMACCLTGSDSALCSSSIVLTREDPNAPSTPRLEREQVAVYYLRAVRSLWAVSALHQRLWRPMSEPVQDGNNNVLLHPTSPEHCTTEWLQLVAVTALGMQYAN